MLIIESEGIKIECEGHTKIVPMKKNYQTQETIYGEDITSFTRVVRNVTVVINLLYEEDYEKLVDIFSYHNQSITVRDTARNFYSTNLFIAGETIELEEFTNLSDLNFCYRGTLQFNRR